MKATSIPVLVLLACVTSACSGSSDSSNPSSPTNQEEVSIPGSPDTDSTTTSAPIVVNGEPMSAFTEGMAELPTNIGEVSEVSLRFPCHDFSNDSVEVRSQPRVAFAQCSKTDGGVVFTSLSSDFAYNEFPSISFDDFPVETFAPSDAIKTEQNWMVSPEGMIVYFVKMVGPDKVEPGVSGTANMTYAGIATIKLGEPAWTIATFQENDTVEWTKTINSVFLDDVMRDDVPLVSYLKDGEPVKGALRRDGSILWELNFSDGSLPFNLNGAHSTIVGVSREYDWINGFLDPLTGNYETVDPAYDDYDELKAFEEFHLSPPQVLMYDNPGVFGVLYGSGFTRLPDSSRLTAGLGGTWRTHVECDVNTMGNIGQGRIDDCNSSNRTYITPSEKTFAWDRRLVAVVGDNALFAESPRGFYVINPNGTEVAHNEDRPLNDVTVAITMNSQYILIDYFLVIRVS